MKVWPSHLFAPDEFPFVVEGAPQALGVVAMGNSARAEFLLGKTLPTSGVTIHVVVAGGDHQFDFPSVRRLTAGEDLVPDFGERLDLLDEPRVGDVARTDDSINRLGGQPSQRLLQIGFGRTAPADVDIGNRTESQCRTPRVGKQVEWEGRPADKGQNPLSKFTPCRIHHVFSYHRNEGITIARDVKSE